jgi:general secretion pathway protein I
MRGFTLIEVVIAFAILGMTLTALYGVFVSSLSRTHHDAQLSEATMLAQSLLSRAGIEFLATGEPIRGQWNEYTYQLTQDIASPPEGQRAYTQPTLYVTAQVTWPGRSGSQDVTLSTVKLWTKALP